mgnify:CR=1 FL=1
MSQGTQSSQKSKSTTKWLEDIRIYVSVKKGAMKNDIEQQKKPEKPQKHKKEPFKLKNLEITLENGSSLIKYIDFKSSFLGQTWEQRPI